MISADDVQEVIKGGVKKQVKDYFKNKYNIDLLKFTKAYGVGVKTVYYIRTEQPLPIEYHSGWAANNASQIYLAKILRDIEAYNDAG